MYPDHPVLSTIPVEIPEDYSQQPPKTLRRCAIRRVAAI